MPGCWMICRSIWTTSRSAFRLPARRFSSISNSIPASASQQELLISIPGIGKLTAARLLAEIGDISAFEDAPQLAAYAGLNPKGSRSGSSVHKKTRISKEGRAFLRYILYMPAIVARKHNPIISRVL